MMKLRARIDKNTVIPFTLDQLVACDDDWFIIRALVRPWLRRGHTPDRYMCTDKNGHDIYEHDQVYIPGGLSLREVTYNEHTYSWYVGQDIAYGQYVSLMEYADTLFDDL